MQTKVLNVLKDHYEKNLAAFNELKKITKGFKLLAINDSKISNVVYNKIYMLVMNTEKLMDKEKPWWNGELWEERVAQLCILRLSLCLTRTFADISFLWSDILFVQKHSTTSLFYSKYNEFKDCVEEIAENHQPPELYSRTLTNYKILCQRIVNLEEENIKRLVEQAKINYLKNKPNSNDSLCKLDERLGQTSFEDEAKNVTRELRKVLRQEVEAAKKSLQEDYDKISKNNQQMESSFAVLVNELGKQEEFLGRFREKHFEEYWFIFTKVYPDKKKEFAEFKFKQPASQPQSPALEKHGMLRKVASFDETKVLYTLSQPDKYKEDTYYEVKL